MGHRLLAERYRPQSFDDFLGQKDHFLPNGIIFRSLEQKRPANILLWGPPGSGKTSFARIYIRSFSQKWVDLHPSTFATSEVKRCIEEAESSILFRPAIFWIDEVHRLTRPQQDLFLKAVEDGSVVIVSATTENPSFVLSTALLSRMTVLSFSALDAVYLQQLIEKVMVDYPHISFTDEAKQVLIQASCGDARKLLNMLDQCIFDSKERIEYSLDMIKKKLSCQTAAIGALGEGRYFLISALHKSVRGSDPQASLYWLSRLFVAGEDPLYIARRLIRMAIEDVGLADPQAVHVALNGRSVYQALGSPEGELALAETVIYLALSPKSSAAYTAFGDAMDAAKTTSHLMPPKHILNAPNRWMEKEGFSKGYIWDHSTKEGFSGQNYFPDGYERKIFYMPVERGFERELIRRNTYFQTLRERNK